MQQALTDQTYWDGIWQFTDEYGSAASPRVETAMTDRYLREAFAAHLGPGRRFIEIGAGGSAWPGHVARTLGAEAWGIDFSRPGLQLTARAAADVRDRVTLVDGDLFDRSRLPAHKFDVVYSGGFVEHFPSPSAVVERFVELLAPGGVVITLVPNLGGANGVLQKLADRETFARHVVHTPASLDAAHALAKLVPVERTRYLDLVDFGCVNFSRVATRLPRNLWRGIDYGLALVRRAGMAWSARTGSDGGRLFAPMLGGVYRCA
ncbi:MAG: Methyltransferase type 11 [bacterium]|nr:Methyltransferase type 11 [bacterium]